MTRYLPVIFLAVTIALGGCARDSEQDASANATPQPGQPASPAGTAAKPMDAAPAPKPAAPRTVTVPAGTELEVVLIDSISSGRNQAGDEFSASLGAPIIVNGESIVARGARLQGRVVDAEDSGRVKGKASIRLTLTSIQAGGKTYPILTNPFVAEAEGTKGRDAGIIGGAAGIGAAIGGIAGGKGGAGKGAVIGGAAGTGTVLATKGKEVELDSESRLKFTLGKSVQLPRIKS